MSWRALTLALAVAAAASGVASASDPIALVDSTGRVVGRPLNETLVLVNVAGIPAPASIRPIFDAEGRAASGQATWHSGGSVLFTSGDCSTGAYVSSSGHAGLRATAQVQTADGVLLFVGATGNPATVTVHSILYGSGCSPVTVQQPGLVSVEVSTNITATYPPPLSFQ
jgi:hypothetical protein